MATRAYTNITTAVAPGGMQPITFGEDGLVIEFFRVQGGTVGDTITIVPDSFTTNVRACTGNIPATDGLTTSANTQCVLTLVASSATDVFYDVQLYCQRQTS